MSVKVAYNFIDLTDGEWHLLPQNAESFILEGRFISEQITIETSHDKSNVSHTIHSLTGNNNHDHYALKESNGDFILQWVRASGFTFDPLESTTRKYPNQQIRLYFSLARRAK